MLYPSYHLNFRVNTKKIQKNTNFGHFFHKAKIHVSTPQLSSVDKGVPPRGLGRVLHCRRLPAVLTVLISSHFWRRQLHVYNTFYIKSPFQWLKLAWFDIENSFATKPDKNWRTQKTERGIQIWEEKLSFLRLIWNGAARTGYRLAYRFSKSNN